MHLARPSIALSFSLFALFFTMWILVPAQLTVLWLVAVVSSEWSLFFGVFAVVGIILGWLTNRKKRSRAGTFAVASGMLALVFVSYPIVTGFSTANNHGVELSLSRYIVGGLFGGLFGGPSQEATIETHAYTTAEEDTLYLDAYLPANPTTQEKRPAVIVIHGGGWSAGKRSDFPRWNHWLIDAGYAVFDIDYQLAPQPNWQAATADVQEAVKWVKMRADMFGVDTTNIALMGRSAGAHLALLAGYTARPESPHDAQVAAIVSFYGPTDLRWGYANPANPRVIDGKATLRAFTGGTPNFIPEVYQQASPIHQIRPSAPATFLVHGRQDQLVRSEHSNKLYRRLRLKSNAPASHKALFLPYAQHGFDFNFHGWGSQITQVLLAAHLAEAFNS